MEFNITGKGAPSVNYTNEETFRMFLQATKASKDCGKVQEAFNACRKTPQGKLIDPQLCNGHATALLTCFQAIRKGGCDSQFNNALACLSHSKSDSACQKEVAAYVDCPHEVSDKFTQYS